MNKEEVLNLAKEQGTYVWKENIEVEATAISYYSAGDSMFTDRQLLAFANACKKIGMEKAAKICDALHGERNGDCAEAIRKST